MLPAPSLKTTFQWFRVVMQFEKNTFVFFEKKTIFYDEKNKTSEKNTEKVFFFFFFFYNKLCIKEKRK